MSWKELYRSRLMAAQEAAEIVQSGDCVWLPLGLGQPGLPIVDAIADRKDDLRDVECTINLALRPYKILEPAYRETFPFMSGFYSTPPLLKIAKSQWANFFVAQGADMAKRYTNRKKIFQRRTGIVVQVTPPDDHGYVNLGFDTFYTEDFLNMSDWAIAEINPNLPRTYGQTNIHVSRFQAFVENPSPVVIFPAAVPSEVEKKIAEHVVTLLHDRDCLQVGLGGVPAAISTLIKHSGLKDLGVHSEMAPIGIDCLVEQGIVTGIYKKVNTGKLIFGFSLGDQKLYDFLGGNPLVEFHPCSYVNNIGVIAQEDNVVAINGSLEVDLTGQVVSESLGNTMISGPGGQLDFVIGAFWSKGGRAINLLPSTTSDAAISRIVPYLAHGARVTVPRHYSRYIVTEYGIADLMGLTEPERAKALIAIAHPKFREDLEKGARERGLLRQKTF
ncbi:MAG: 4-hydroxybutyrate CoA-transferase [Deltaproteobacteria bacterium HGW-Deltaproteobacteria-12]|jgi:4-hydroxybutyrate CoA-transferase|nr:MAG: 4-hydroxybutyrate CoA-transferase [Deltaproteobacteria bacterium HGW-Deltaproteobacteria-12]